MKTFRTNTVLLVDAKGHATYVERTMEDDATDPDEAEWRINKWEFDMQDTDNCWSVETLMENSKH